MCVCVKLLYVKFVYVKLLYVKFVCEVYCVRRREEREEEKEPGIQNQKQPAGPETVPIKRMFFFFLNVILPQCRADLMIGNPGKTWGAFFGFSASSLQRMRSNMSRSQRSQRS